jgi:hypothetical protein
MLIYERIHKDARLNSLSIGIICIMCQGRRGQTLGMTGQLLYHVAGTLD